MLGEYPMSEEKFLRWDHASGLLIDLEMHETIDPVTGTVAAQSVLDESESSQLPKRNLVDPAEFCAVLLELACEGLTVTHNKEWKRQMSNPDLRIGQTVPYTTHLYEEVKNGAGASAIRFCMPSSDRANKVPNCVEIEHTIGKRLTEEEATRNSHRDLDDHLVEFAAEDIGLPEFPETFEALQLLAAYLERAPQDKSWRILPTLITFLFEKINLVYPGGDVSIPDLLSIYHAMSVDLDGLRKKNKELHLKIDQMRTTIKHLRSIKFGRKHKYHP
jgi:hypothetical protein